MDKSVLKYIKEQNKGKSIYLKDIGEGAYLYVLSINSCTSSPKQLELNPNLQNIIFNYFNNTYIEWSSDEEGIQILFTAQYRDLESNLYQDIGIEFNLYNSGTCILTDNILNNNDVVDCEEGLEWFLNTVIKESDSTPIIGLNQCDWCEDEVAKLFVKNYNDWCYDSINEVYYSYKGGVWIHDNTLISLGNKFAELMERCSNIYKNKLENNKKKSEYKNYLAILNKIQKFRALNTSERTIRSAGKKYNHIIAEDLDNDRYILNFRNGYYDLKDHVFIEDEESQKKMMLTRQIGMDFTFNNDDCPLFKEFLELSLGDLPDSKEVIEFVQMMFGYILTGSTDYEAAFFFYGEGRNGKTTLIKVLENLLNYGNKDKNLQYAKRVPEEFFKSSYYDRHPTELMTIRNGRLAIGEEIQGQKLNLQRLKLICTKDSDILAHHMRKDFTSSPNQAKALVSFNQPPEIDEQTVATFARIFTIPFKTHIVKKLHSQGLKDDKEFYLKLYNESSGILNWSIEGLKKLQSLGAFPNIKSITNETNKVIYHNNTIDDFITNCCVTDSKFYISKKSLYDVCIKLYPNKELKLSDFYSYINKEGFIDRKINNSWCFLGVSLSDDILTKYQKITGIKIDKYNNKP